MIDNCFEVNQIIVQRKVGPIPVRQATAVTVVPDHGSFFGEPASRRSAGCAAGAFPRRLDVTYPTRRPNQGRARPKGRIRNPFTIWSPNKRLQVSLRSVQ